MHDAAHPYLAAGADDSTRKDRGSGGEECPVIDLCSVDVRMWPDQDVATDAGLVPGSSPDQRVLHDDRVRTDVDTAVLCGDDSTEQDPHAGSDVHGSADDGIRRHVRVVVHDRALSSVLDQHPPTVAHRRPNDNRVRVRDVGRDTAQESAASHHRCVTMTDPTGAIVRNLFDRIGTGASPTELAEYFHEDVDWFVPGDTAVVPWIGRKVGRAGVAEFYQQLRDLTTPVAFTIDHILSEGTRAVVLGHLVTEVNATGRRIDSDFAFDIEVDGELIVGYRMFEDTWAVAQAMR